MGGGEVSLILILEFGLDFRSEGGKRREGKGREEEREIEIEMKAAFHLHKMRSDKNKKKAFGSLDILIKVPINTARYMLRGKDCSIIQSYDW